MVTIDLEIDRQWDELFRKVEAGEILRVVRGNREIAVVTPTLVERDEEDAKLWAEMAMRQWAEVSPVDEFADWKQPDGTR